MIGDYARGVRLGLDGVRILADRPRLWPLVLLPFAISLAVLVGIVAAVIALRGHFITGRPIVALLTAIAVPVVCYFAFLPIAALVAAPFNDAISARVEAALTGRPPTAGPPSTLLGDIAGVGRSLVHEARTFLRWALLAGAVLVASIVLPGIGSLVGLVGGGYLAARFAGWDAIDTPLGRWGWSYDRRLAFLRSHRALCLGTGTVVAAALAVPILNAMAMPLAAAAGTALAVATVPEAGRK